MFGSISIILSYLYCIIMLSLFCLDHYFISLFYEFGYSGTVHTHPKDNIDLLFKVTILLVILEAGRHHFQLACQSSQTLIAPEGKCKAKQVSEEKMILWDFRLNTYPEQG